MYADKRKKNRYRLLAYRFGVFIFSCLSQLERDEFCCFSKTERERSQANTNKNMHKLDNMNCNDDDDDSLSFFKLFPTVPQKCFIFLSSSFSCKKQTEKYSRF